MTFTIRPIDMDRDLVRLAEIFTAIDPEPSTADELRHWWSQSPEGAVRNRLVAQGQHGTVIGYGNCLRDKWTAAGKYSLSIQVDPVEQRQGVGSRLLAEQERFARLQGATLLETGVRDHNASALAFARKHGYQIHHHLFESTLDLTRFDPTRFAGVVEAVEATGVRFFTLADQPGEATERLVYDVVRRNAWDLPFYDAAADFPYEQWRKWVLEAPDFRADCLWIAADGDRLAGITHAGPITGKNGHHTHHTSVLREYRGRGLALALKLKSIQTATGLKVAYMRTNNDSTNAPMLAVNRKLGYEPAPGVYMVQKVLN